MPCVLARRDSVLKEALSTASSRDSCAKVETSPREMELEERASMEKNLLMKTSS